MDTLTANDRLGEHPPSYYAASASKLGPFPCAQGKLKADICVIGGGFTGLSTALHLARRGYRVVLLEANRVGFGASGRNGGQLGYGQRVDQEALEQSFGKERAKALWNIAVDSVDLVRELALSEEVHTSFQPGLLHVDHRERFVDESKAYAEKLNKEYGYSSIRFVDREECRYLVNSPAYHGGVLDIHAGHIHPLELAFGLARLAVASGVEIYERSRVVEIHQGAQSCVRTEEAEIWADFVVLGCNGYLGGLNSHIASKVMPINNYIIATRPFSEREKADVLRDNLAVADSKFVVNYFRFSEDNRLLFGGTESYGYRFPQDIAAKVRRPLAKIFPHLQDIQIDYAWGGTLGITMNRMPHFERINGNILSMSGFSGHGVGMATLSGKLAADAIAGNAERFDVMAQIPMPSFPGGERLRNPLLVLAMLWYSLRDKF